MEIKHDFYGKIGNSYNIIRKITEGGFGKIYLVKDNELNKEYVAKTFSENDKSFDNEVTILKIFAEEKKCQNIVEFIDSGNDDVEIEDEGKEKRNYIILKYYEKGNLLKYVPIGGFDENFVKVIFKNILEIIDKIHNINICHLDLKLQNILLDNDYNIIIADFGLSKQINDQNKGIFTQSQGTRSHMPPQMFLKKRRFKGDKYDIFSLGIILYRLLNGKTCFNEASPDNYNYNQLIKKEDNYFEKIELLFPLKCSDKFKKLFVRMVAYDENERPSIKEIINDDWLNEINVFTDEERRNIIKGILEKRNEEIELIIATNELNKQIYEAFNEQPIFNEKTKIKCLKNNIKADNYILINGNLNPIDYMNKLADEMEELYDDIEPNKKNYLKFNITIKKKELKKEAKDNNDEDGNKNNSFSQDNVYGMEKDLKIQIELFKIIDKGFLLDFIKIKGSLLDYYYYLEKIKNDAVEILMEGGKYPLKSQGCNISISLK